MASKVKQVIQNLTVEKDKKGKGGKAPTQREEESCLLEDEKPGGARRLVPNFQWAIPNRHVDHNEDGEDEGQGMEAKGKSKKQLTRSYMCLLEPGPDYHSDICLVQ
ncbi:protein BEX4-like [Apodemus sylvaticus]|uniref:protein BEX4-like n=1 Tax=Apodemus sylvaticus TaxID=10129 RepID=UPI0022433768|nr:protein BEX4-like [Apodemus sylvaticus]